MKPMEQDSGVNIFDEYFMKDLSSDEPNERYLAIKNIKNSLIGMKTRKSQYINAGLIERLLELMVEENTMVEFAVEAAVVLGSLAKGDTDNLRHILNSQTIPLLCKGVCHEDERLVIACLRSLRICFMSNQVPPDLIYEDQNLVSTLVQLLTKNSQTAECAANILRRSCKSAKDQSMLYDAGVIPSLVIWLEHKQPAVLIPTLACLTELTHNNEVVADGLFNDIRTQLLKLIVHSKSDEVQLQAATCLTRIIRALPNGDNFALKQIERKLLTVFVRMCHKKVTNIKTNAALSLAYLIEDDNELQEMAALSNHLIKNIANYFLVTDSMEKETIEKLRQSGFQLYAALSANDEKIRKEIVVSTPNLILYIHEAVNQEGNILLQASALQCLLSLSRSVQQLRTTFKDVKLWEPVISALKSSTSDDIISVASSVLCNLLLDFSPCKEDLVDYGALDVLIALMKRTEAPFRVNGVWGLMNLAYDANDSLKNRIIDSVGMPTILNLVNDQQIDIAVKALGILRNLLTEKAQDIDNVMRNHGVLIIGAIKPLVLNNDLQEQMKEQVLCLLSNIANGSYAKTLLMAEETLLTKIIYYISSENEQLQTATVFCITNLARNQDNDIDRNHSTKLRDLGAEKQLNMLLNTSNANLLERVKNALSKFN